MNYELIKALLVIAISSSIVSTAFVQKIKGISIIKCSDCIVYISFLVSMLFGIVFTITFTSYNIIDALWVGLFSFLGADSLYKTFEDKIFKSYSNINNIIEISRK